MMTQSSVKSIWVFVNSVVIALATGTLGFSQTAWEYSPYRVSVWVSSSPSLGWNDWTEQQLYKEIQNRCEQDFGSAWSIRSQATPDSLFGTVLYRIDEVTVPQVLAREMVLVVGKSDKAKAKFLELSPPPPPPTLTKEEEEKRKKMTKEQIREIEDAAARAASLNSVRTFESALERIDSFHVPALPYAGLQRDIVPFLSDEKWKKFQSKVKPFVGNLAALKKALQDGEIVAALVPKTDLSEMKDVSRPIPARLPWQPESLLKEYDKIFMASVERVGEIYRVRVREMDAMVRNMSDVSSIDIVRQQDIGPAIAHQIRQVFAPMVRIEDTDNNTATMRVRAAGLINDEKHPANVGLGDVVVPFIRRDDINGNPTMLQALPFTFIAATEKIDNVSMYYGAIFTSSRGALNGAKNRRTQRLALKIHAKNPASQIRLTFRPQPMVIPKNAMREAPKPPAIVTVPGAEIYRRTPGHEDLDMLGRTDWRGVVPVTKLENPIIKYELPESSKNPSIAKARSFVRDPVPPPKYPDPPPPEYVPEQATTAADASKEDKSESGEKSEEESLVKKPTEVKVEPLPPKPVKGEIQINVPLYLYYVKNGETLLARLPVVTGLYSSDEARLPDDRLRLETEAFMRGLQNEVLDIVVRRKILETRIKKRLTEGKLPEAEKFLAELRRVKSFEKMSEQVENIERRALDDNNKVGPMLKKKIQGMSQTTREMLEKWLQDNLLRDLEMKVNEAK